MTEKIKCKCPECPGCITKETKRACKTCAIEKPLSMFDKTRKSCKVCRKNYNARCYKARKNKVQDTGKELQEEIKIIF